MSPRWPPCSTSADQAGNADYNAALQVTQGFTVNAGSQSITFGACADQSAQFQHHAICAEPGCVLISGLTIAYTTTNSSVCTAKTSITTLTAGVCTIAANQAGTSQLLPWQVTQSVTVMRKHTVAPTIGICCIGATQATIGLTPPASNGGGILTYTATCNAVRQTTRTGTGGALLVVVASMKPTGTAQLLLSLAVDRLYTSPAFRRRYVNTERPTGEGCSPAAPLLRGSSVGKLLTRRKHRHRAESCAQPAAGDVGVLFPDR